MVSGVVVLPVKPGCFIVSWVSLPGPFVHALCPAENPGPTISLPTAETNHDRLTLSPCTLFGACCILTSSWLPDACFAGRTSPANNLHETNPTNMVNSSPNRALLPASSAFLFHTTLPCLRGEDSQ
jgi:hypothetical protein